MKRFLVLGLGLGAFLLVGVSMAHAFSIGDRVQVVAGTYNLNVRPTPSTSQTALGSVNAGALGTVTGGPTSAEGYSWSQVRWDSGLQGWSVNTPWLTVISSSSTASCGDVNKDGRPDILDVNLVVNVAFRGASSTYITDVNGSGATDVVDVAEEVDYVFRGMAEPTGCVQPNQPPVINSFNGPTSSMVGVGQNWYIRATDPDGDLLSYYFGWGDGQYSGPVSAPSGLQVAASHAYGFLGTYNVTSSVSDSRGGLAYGGPLSVTVFSSPSSTPNQPPINFQIFGQTPLTTSTWSYWYFRATDPEGGNLTYSVNWGDGTSDNATGTSGQYTRLYHNYPGNGTYTINSIATDQGGLSISATVSVIVSVGTASLPPTPIYQQTSPPPTIAPQTTVTYQCGDLDKSGAVNTIDVKLMQNYWTGGVTVPTGVNADVNGDGVVADILDYSLLNNYVNKGGPAPTCSAAGGTKTFTPAANALEAMQAELQQIQNQLIAILNQLGV
ncbi:MAG: hypothetical protein HY093_02935 [Candidatus Liptonbacteria bacterium]|nr:hypothetical protein [Candidatus Liptonbacteria bacterium]